MILLPNNFEVHVRCSLFRGAASQIATAAMSLYLLVSHVLYFADPVAKVVVLVVFILDRCICRGDSLDNLMGKWVRFVLFNLFTLLSSMIAVLFESRGGLFKHFKLSSIQIQRCRFATLLIIIIIIVFPLLTRGLLHHHFIVTARYLLVLVCLDQYWLEWHRC